MHDLLIIAISLLIGIIAGFWLAQATGEHLSQEKLLELRKYAIDKEIEFIHSYDEEDEDDGGKA